MKLKCPLCLGVTFASEETLLHSLLSFASINIACPLCIEVLRGSDKFTIHLCSHVFNFKSPDTVSLTPNACAKVVSLNEIFENIHLDGPTESAESELLKMQTEMTSDEGSVLKNSSWSNLGALAYPNVEPTSTNESEKLSERISEFQPNMNTVAAPRVDYVDESKNSESPSLEATQVICPQVLQNIYEFPPQASLPSNISLESSSAFCAVAEPIALQVDDIFKNFDFIFNVDESIVDFPQPMEDPSTDLKRSQSELASTLTETHFNVEEHSDPGDRDVNINLNRPCSSPRPNTLCEICSISFPDVNILRLHKELVHEKTDKCQYSKPKFQCDLCKRKFKLKASLLAHQRVAHAVENGCGFIDAGVNDESSPFQCNMCHKIFKKENYLIQHLKTHEEKQWTCDECGKIFATKHFLQNHKRLHTGEMPYICSICNKQFTFQQSYHRHVAYHNSEKPHRCKECGKSFKELSTLYNHQRIHTGEKPFSCDICGKSFRQRVTCLMHSRIHTNSKDFKCSKCQKSFRYKISLRSHKCVHSATTASTEVSSLQQ